MASLDSLPPPPQGQTGITLDAFNHLPPPPSGQKGVTLAELNTNPANDLTTNKGPLGNFISNVATGVKKGIGLFTGSENAAGQDIAAALPGSVTGTDALSKTNEQGLNSDIAFVKAIGEQRRAGIPITPTQQAIYDHLLQTHGAPQTTAADLTPAITKTNAQVAGDFGGVAADIATAGTYSKAGLLGADAMKLPGLTRATPVVSSVGKQTVKDIAKQTLSRTLTGGGVGYGYDVANNLQEGKTGLPALTPGAATLAGATIPALVGGVKMGVAITKEQAPRFINSLVKPKLADFSYGKDPGRTVSELGITGNSLSDFGHNITAAKKDVGKKLGAIYKSPENANVRINAASDISKIDTAMSEAAKGGKNNQTIVNQLKNIKDAILYEHAIDENGNIVKVGDTPRDLSKLSPQEAQALIQHVADQTQFTGRPSDDKTVNSILKQIYGSIREKINKGVSVSNPEIEKLNQQYADLTSAEIATRNRDKIVQRSNFVSLPSGGAATGGAIVAAIATGGSAIPVALAGASSYAVEKAFESAAVKTRVASWLGKQTPNYIQKYLRDNPKIAPVFVRTFPALVGKLVNNSKNSSNQ